MSDAAPSTNTDLPAAKRSTSRYAIYVFWVMFFINLLNYLDRQVLATMAEVWRSRPDFPFTATDYPHLISVFSIAFD